MCKGCQLAKKKCAMTEEGLIEGEKKKAVSRGKKRARDDGSSDEVVEIAEVKGPQTVRARRQTEKEWEEDWEWKRSILGTVLTMSQKLSGMEQQLVAVGAGSNRMVPTLDAVWGALQALISQEQDQELEPSVEEDVRNEEDEEDEAEETLMSFLIVCGCLYPFLHISAFPFTLRAHLAALYIQISHHLHSLLISFTASP